MPLDTSIILGAKPIQIDYAQFSPVNSLMSAMKLKQMKQEGDLNELTLNERQGIQNYLATKPDLKSSESRYKLATEFGEAGRKLATAATDIGRAETEDAKRRAELTTSKTAQYRDALNNVNDRSTALQWIEMQQQDPDMAGSPIAKMSMMQAANMIPADPTGFDKWRQQAALGMTKYIEANKPHFTQQDLGGTTRVLATPGLGGTATVVPGSAAGKTMTPGESARLAAETATGTLTPESLDVAANVYLQTGQLPTGLGKSAAALRTQVMNRATELSSGKPAAEVAGGIVESKQDVASRGKSVKDFSTGVQGRQVNAFNTAIDHLSTMDKLTDALGNSDIKAINSLGNVIARQTGQPAPTNFDAAKQIVTAEVIKAVVASGGGVTERQEAERNFAAANSPAQLKGIINTYQDLLGGQLKSLNLQYENTTGRKDFDKKLTPAAQQVVARIRGGEEQKTTPVLQGQDKQALEWANANPKDPRAAAIKQRLGL